MVANLSMPTYYRFHFPTWMETHKGLKNCFCSFGSPHAARCRRGNDRSIFFIRLVSDRAGRSGDVYSRLFFLQFRPLLARNASEIKHDGQRRGQKPAVIDQMRESIRIFLTKEYISNDASALTQVATMLTKDLDYLSICVSDTHLFPIENICFRLDARSFHFTATLHQERS